MATLKSLVWLASGLGALVDASPAPAARPVAAPHPMITPAPVVELALERRDFLQSIEAGVTSLLSSLGSAVPSYVASGRPTARNPKRATS